MNGCAIRWRSEEHTSELQSLMRSSYAVFHRFLHVRSHFFPTLLSADLGCRHCVAWLAYEGLKLAGVSDLRAVHIDGFASALERRGMGAIHRHMTVSKVINTLRAIEADRPDRIAPDLHERLRYTLATSAGRSTPRDAYSSDRKSTRLNSSH